MARKRRHTEEQIIGILKEVEAGMKVADVCRKYNICDVTYYKWRSKYSGMEVSDAKRLKALEDENSRLKKIVADQVLNIDVLKAVLEKKF
jgi:putative transposase